MEGNLSARERLLINKNFMKIVRNEHTHTQQINKAHHLTTNIFWMHYLLHSANDLIVQKKRVRFENNGSKAIVITSSTPTTITTCIQWINGITKRFNS